MRVSMVQLISCFISSKALGKHTAIQLVAHAKFLPWNRVDCTNNEAFPSERRWGKTTGPFQALCSLVLTSPVVQHILYFSLSGSLRKYAYT